MQKGFNSDVNVRGKVYHVQTEDWGTQSGVIVSRVFCNGAVVKSIKTPYAEILAKGSVNSSEAVKSALKNQHQRIVSELIEGRG